MLVAIRQGLSFCRLICVSESSIECGIGTDPAPNEAPPALLRRCFLKMVNLWAWVSKIWSSLSRGWRKHVGSLPEHAAASRSLSQWLSLPTV